MAKPTRTVVRDHTGGNAVTTYPASGLTYDVWNNSVADAIQGYAENIAKWASGHMWVAEDYASLSAAITAIGATPGTLLVSSSINASNAVEAVTVPDTLSILPMRPGVISKGSATGLTINGSVVGNPMHQWLSGFAAGEVTFGSAVSETHSVWVGTDEVAMNTFINALQYGGKIVKRAAIEDISGQVTFDNTLITLEGTSFSYRGSTKGTIIRKAVNIALAMHIFAEHCSLRNFKLECNNKTGDGILIQNCQATLKDIYITNVGTGGIALELNQSSVTHLERVRITDSYQGLVIGGATGSQLVNIDDFQYNIDTPGDRSHGLTLINATSGAYRMLNFDTDPAGKAIVIQGNNTDIQFTSVYIENTNAHTVDSLNLEGSGNKNISFDGLYINHGVNNIRNMISVSDGTRGLHITNAHLLTAATVPITCIYVSSDAEVTLRDCTSSGGVTYFLLDSANVPAYTTGINIDGHMAVGARAQIRLNGFSHSVKNCKNTDLILNVVHDVVVENMDLNCNISIAASAYNITLINCTGSINISSGATGIVCINCTGTITGVAININNQQAANANTALTFTGTDTVAKADIVLLQTEVNELKALLRNTGLMAT